MKHRHNCERCWTQDPEAPTVKKYDEWLCPGHVDDVEEEARVLLAEAHIEFANPSPDDVAWAVRKMQAELNSTAFAAAVRGE
jgi:hypothetical protein